LLFTRAELPALRERAKLPGVAADPALIDEMNRRDPGRMNPTTAAVVYAMTGKTEYREQARKLVLQRELGHYVQDSGLYAYDILYDELSPEERSAFQQKALAHIRLQWNVGTRLCYALGIWGDCEDPAIEKTIAEQAPLFDGWDDPGGLNWWAGSRGGDTRSFHYIHQNTMTPWANATMCWSKATGTDRWEKAAWAKHLPMYYLYHLVPGFERTVHIGVNCNPPPSPGDNADAYFSFLIMSRGGCMAADTGTRWGNGEGPGGHVQMYFRQTVAHNSITVGDEDVKTPDGDGIRGGQVVPTQPEWFARWGVEGQPYFSERRYEGVGRIVAFASCPEWTCAAGDASRSYSPDYVKVFTRQFRWSSHPYFSLNRPSNWRSSFGFEIVSVYRSIAS
jgi:hypothetical protein